MNTNLESELFELENQFWSALRDKDITTALALTDFPCILTGPQGISSIDEATFTSMMTTAPHTLDDFEIDRNAKVRLVNRDVAIIAYKAREHVTVDGSPIRLEVADSSTWIRRDGKWRCAQHTEAIVGDPFGRGGETKQREESGAV